MKRLKSINIVVPKESYSLEKRVVVLPSSAKSLIDAGHRVFVQAGASSGLDIPDKKYADSGAVIISDAAELYGQAENGMVVKMKAPFPEEFSFMKHAILLCMLHIEQNKERLYYMGSQELVGVAMEDIRDRKGKRLVNQTGITGQMGVYYAIRHFQKLPSDMKAVILGYGNVATGAIEACARLGIGFKIMRRRELGRLHLWLKDADLLVNAISWPAKQTGKQEHLITREHIQNSNPGMIVLDLAVDFPNSPIETMHPTTYQNPFYMEDGHVHISIYGYPGLVPVTSSRIYSEQISPIALAIANNGGLKGIGRAEGIGKSIRRAVVDPSRYGNWQAYKPVSSQSPKIE